MRRGAKGWAGYENENWKVRELSRYSIEGRAWLYFIECKGCGKICEKRVRNIQRHKSCGCKNPAPVNKGTSAATMQDMVASPKLLRMQWL